MRPAEPPTSAASSGPGARTATSAPTERAASLTVNTPADDFDTCTAAGCSLREAVEYAGVGGTVAVPAGEYVLSRGSLEVARSVVIQGAGARSTTLRGSGERVLTITGGGSTVSGVRITGGNASEGQPFGGQGGGVSIEGAELNLVDSTVDGNVAGVGGGIFTVDGFFSATGSTIAANEAIHAQAGIGGGLYLSDSSARLTNSTVSGNSATQLAGGIFSLGTNLELFSVTIANNSVTTGQLAGTALFRQPGDDGDGGETGETFMRNTLIAAHPGEDCSVRRIARGHQWRDRPRVVPGLHLRRHQTRRPREQHGPDEHARAADRQPGDRHGRQLPADRPAGRRAAPGRGLRRRRLRGRRLVAAERQRQRRRRRRRDVAASI